ncbi:MAG: MarR family winged helix-turn-helix transcriptional regulator [Vicinamibacterales bacterium]
MHPDGPALMADGGQRPRKTVQGRTRESVRTHLRIASCYNLLMREARQRIATRWRLTLPQFDVLAELARADAGGFTFVELSRLLLVTSGNLTGIVDRLQQQRLVERRPDSRDRRVIRVALTDKGRRVTDEVLPAHAADIEEFLAFMPRTELTQLSELLGRLRDGLHARADRERPSAPRKPQTTPRAREDGRVGGHTA